MTAPTPPEVREAAVLEEVAQAMHRRVCDCGRGATNIDRDMAAAAVAAYRATQDGVNALEPLIAEVRRGRALRERLEGLAEEWRYKGEYGWGAWQEGHGPDLEGTVLEAAATTLRAVLAAVDPS